MQTFPVYGSDGTDPESWQVLLVHLFHWEHRWQWVLLPGGRLEAWDPEKEEGYDGA